MTLTVGALCAGYGGLELGLTHAGIDHRVEWFAEIDDAAATVMAAAHPDTPNLGDLCAITEPPPVDIITAGFPCQPVSLSGHQGGINDERWLIRDVVAVWRRSAAPWLILENVPGLFSANRGEAFGQVLDALSEVGAPAEWACLRAADVGAPHRRNRWFCLARNAESGPGDGLPIAGPESDRETARALRRPNRSTENADGESWNEWGFAASGQAESGRARADVGGGRSGMAAVDLLPTPTAGDGTGGHRATNLEWRGGTAYRPSGAKASVSLQETLDTQIDRLLPTPTASDHKASGGAEGSASVTLTDAVARGRVPWGRFQAAIERWEHLTRPAPPPTTDNGRLSPVFVEWMQGLDEGHVTSHGLKRAAELKILGNGVVPHQAGHAIAHLTQRLIEGSQ